MPRQISPAGLRSLLSSTSGDCWVWGITINHPQMPQPIRVTSDGVPHLIDGHEYLAGEGLEVTLAADSGEEVPKPVVKIGATDPFIVGAARSVSSHPQMTLEIFRIDPAGNIDREWGPESYDMLAFDAGQNVMQATLGYQVDWLNEPAMHHSFNPNLCPALF